MSEVVTSKPDVHDMVVVHRTFRQSCAELPELVRGLRPGDTARAELVVEAVQFMLMGLEAHHVSEDEFLWPRLAARTAGQAETIARMEQQHHRLEELVTQVTGALDQLAADPRQPLCEQVADQLAELGAVLTAHMDEEENTVLPLAAEHLTVAEWEELGEISLAKIEKKHLLRAFSALMAVATPEERQTLLTKAPLPARVLWRLTGRRSHTRREARLRGA
ncbi:hemerythrin domain-containing protein [Streptomyces prunicolor]|uniref:Hemerythrin domain-containing protein n=1 Tax=Streptomyces prunicolor TaxID=67348 RepID=A0ABU4FAG6_9ACTN|nr:hemerythrin domain-containing protein [Streptomyces prunicolor]MCX5243532.1 hemerythrin domain-containing protein [Streptomyces prunicolor]MDV7217584.1 hemerythrin domain-containing protein [Streptomyces prunicolor]